MNADENDQSDNPDAIGVTTAAFARIGDDEKQIEARYGKPGKDLGNHGEVHEVGYVSGGFMILVDFVNRISQREGFAKPDTSALTDVATLQILALSAAEGTNWEPTPGSGGDRRRSQFFRHKGSFFLCRM